jgi:tRNA (guanine-N7-)-methyltransferase
MDELAPYLFEPASREREGPEPEPPSTPVAPAPGSPIDWKQLFGNDRPVEIEVGSGKGAFLVAAAEANLDTNYLGIEIDRALQLYVATRLAKRGLHNARVASTDARRLFHDRIAESSVRAVHVYFPDPWWKKRHHKRRVWTPAFAADCVRVLVPGGRLHVATDVAEYGEIIRELLAAQPGLIQLHAEEQTGPPTAEETLTNFERKARQRGGAVYRAEYERR